MRGMSNEEGAGGSSFDIPHSSFVRPKGAILFCGEDDPADTVRPRLDALGADPRRITLAGVRDDEVGPPAGGGEGGPADVRPRRGPAAAAGEAGSRRGRGAAGRAGGGGPAGGVRARGRTATTRGPPGWCSTRWRPSPGRRGAGGGRRHPPPQGPQRPRPCWGRWGRSPRRRWPRSVLLATADPAVAGGGLIRPAKANLAGRGRRDPVQDRRRRRELFPRPQKRPGAGEESAAVRGSSGSGSI